jgi:tetratricopeptide (TPR) repeat protein
MWWKNNRSKKALYLFIVLSSCFPSDSYRTFAQPADSLKGLLKKLNESTSPAADTSRCRVLSLLSLVTPDGEWQTYNQQLKELSEKNLGRRNLSPELARLYKKYLADAWSGIGYCYQNKEGNSEKAMEHFRKSQKLREEIGDKTGLAESLNNIGGVYQNLGNVGKSIEYYRKSLALNEQLHDEFGIANTLNNLALTYLNQRDTVKSLEYYYRSLAKYIRIGYQEGIAIAYNNIGRVYHEKGQPEKALEFYNKSFAIHKTLGNKNGMALAYNNIGVLHSRRNDFSKSLEYYQKTRSLYQETNNRKGMALALSNIGHCYYKQKKYDLAVSNTEAALTISRELGYPDEILFAARTLKSIYHDMHNDSKALDMLELAVKMHDSISKENMRRENIKKQYQYEFESRERELTLKQEAGDQLQQLLFRQKQTNIIVGFALLITALAAIFALLYYKNRLDKEKKQQALELMVKDSEIKALRAQMNPHFIFNSLNSVLELIRLSNKEEALHYLAKLSKLIRAVLESSDKKMILLSDEMDLLRLYVDLENLRFGGHLRYNFSIDDDLDADNIEIPALIIQPFIENAILHGLLNKKEICSDAGEAYEAVLSVHLQRENSFLKCVIEDNGIGMEKADELKQGKNREHRPMGMKMTRERLDLLSRNPCSIVSTDLVDSHGEIAGTRVEITIPITEVY